MSIVGPDAARKAERTAEALIARARHLFAQTNLGDFSATHVEALGAEASYGGKSQARATARCCCASSWSIRAARRSNCSPASSARSGLSCAPGTTGIFGGRPRPTPVVRLFTFFVEKGALPPPQVQIGEGTRSMSRCRVGRLCRPPAATLRRPPTCPASARRGRAARLALARSGDKGNSSNIAIIARKPDYVPLLRRVLTPERMAAHFAGLVHGPVQRFEAPGLNAFNFLLEDALGGGGMASRRIDPQGKAYGQMALEMMVPVPQSVARLLPGAD